MAWIRLEENFYHHPKVVAAGPEASWLYVAGLCYCSQHATDGRIPKSSVPLLTSSKKPMALAERLVVVGLWDDQSGRYVVPDYLEYQRSKAEIEEIKEARRAAGKRGGKASAAKRWGDDEVSKDEANGKQVAYGVLEAKGNPHTHTHTDTQEDLPTREVTETESAVDLR